MELLPLDLYGEIVKFLKSRDIIHLGSTCKRLAIPDETIISRLIEEYYSAENLLFNMSSYGYTNLFQKVLSINAPVNQQVNDNLLSIIKKNFHASGYDYYKGRDNIEVIFCYLHIYVKLTPNWDQIFPIIIKTFQYKNVVISNNMYDLVEKFVQTDRYTDIEKYNFFLQQGGLSYVPDKLVQFVFAHSKILDPHITKILESIYTEETFNTFIATGKITNQHILDYLQTPDRYQPNLVKLLTPSQLAFLRQQSNYIISNFQGPQHIHTLNYLIDQNVITIDLAANKSFLHALISNSAVISRLSPTNFAYIKSQSASIVRDMIANKKIPNLLPLIEKGLIHINTKSSKKIWNHLVSIKKYEDMIFDFARTLCHIPLHLVVPLFANLSCYTKHRMLTIPEIATLADKMMLELIYSGFYTTKFKVPLNTLNLDIAVLAKILTHSVYLTKRMCGANDIDDTMISNSQIILDQLDINMISNALTLVPSITSIITYLIQVKKCFHQPLLIANADIIIDPLLSLKDSSYIKQVLKIILPHVSKYYLQNLYRHLFKIHPYIKFDLVATDDVLYQKILTAL